MCYSLIKGVHTLFPNLLYTLAIIHLHYQPARLILHSLVVRLEVTLNTQAIKCVIQGVTADLS